MSSFLRNEEELAEQVDEIVEPVVSESETEPLTQIDLVTPSRSATDLLAEVVELHQEVMPEENTLERVHDEEDSFKMIGNDDLTEESAAFEALEHEIEESNLSNIEEVTEESSKDVTPAVPEPSSGTKVLSMQLGDATSIQDAFKLRKQKFIENSAKRQEKVKGMSFCLFLIYEHFIAAFYEPPKQPEFVKVTTKTAKSPTRIPRLSSSKTTKISDKEARNRTRRIYERSDEYKGI